MVEIIALDVAEHWDQVWEFFEPVLRAGATFPNDVNSTKDEALNYWNTPEKTTFVATKKDGAVVGIYYIKPNQPSLGAHVCNCGYVVDPGFRGQGVATKMCLHSQDYAKTQGYRAMQYNLVVSTNHGGFRLWQSQGFDIVGTLPGGFKHKDHGYVDAHIMFKSLV